MRAELDNEDAQRQKEEREGVRSNSFQAYWETLHPFVERLAGGMQKDLG